MAAAWRRKITKIVKNCHMEGQWPYANCMPGGSGTCYYIEITPSGGVVSSASTAAKKKDRFVLYAAAGKATCCEVTPATKTSSKRRPRKAS